MYGDDLRARGADATGAGTGGRRVMRGATVVLVVLLSAVAAAQVPQTPPAAGRGAGPAGAPAPAPAAPVEPLAPQGYTYDPDGRRDPFVSLVRRGADIGVAPGERPPGLAGMTSAEIVLKGTIKGQTGWVAMVQGTDNKTYMVAPGERLLDGTVRTITADTMVILQRVNDPLSLETTREVRKVLRQTEEAK
jgi:hypothetical protein